MQLTKVAILTEELTVDEYTEILKILYEHNQKVLKDHVKSEIRVKELKAFKSIKRSGSEWSGGEVFSLEPISPQQFIDTFGTSLIDWSF